LLGQDVSADRLPAAISDLKARREQLADVMIGNVEHDQLSTILDCVAKDFEVDIERAIADSAYITGENLTAAESKSVELVGPLSMTK